MSPRVRWVCPACGDGLLGLRRPRRDDVRRYCLPCSEKTGRLVERVAPSLERQRRARASAVRVRSKRTRTRERERTAHLDRARRALARMCRMACWAREGVKLERHYLEIRPGETLRGRAARHGWVVVPKGKDPISVDQTILHELTHVALHRLEGGRKNDIHGKNFRALLLAAASEWFKVPEADLLAGWTGRRGMWSNRAYALDYHIVRAVRAAREGDDAEVSHG